MKISEQIKADKQTRNSQIDGAGKELGRTIEALRFFELRGLYNRGKVGQMLVWNALNNARNAAKLPPYPL